MNSNSVKATILCITYNHEKFIRDALDGFVMQKTNFPFEVIVHDDASTDKTPEIIQEYQLKYPDIIKPVLQTENQFSQGRDPIIDFMAEKVQGEYVALNEGDDYWTDENKLQKQVDFLDAHPDFAVCFHPVKIHWENGEFSDSVFPTPKDRFYKTELKLADLLRRNFIQTNSVMYRWRKDITAIWPKRKFEPTDIFLHCFHAQMGKIAFLPDVMSVYRKQDGGIWNQKDMDAFSLKNDMLLLVFYEEMEKCFHVPTLKKQLFCARRLVATALKFGRWDLLEKMRADFPETFEKVLAEISNKGDKKTKKLYRYIRILSFVNLLLLILSAYLLVRGVL